MASDFAKASLPGGVVNDILNLCARHNVSEETFFITAWSYTIAIYNGASLVTTSVIRDGKKNKVVIEFDSRMTILEACSPLHYTKICSGADSEHSPRSSTPGGELHDDPATILFAQNGPLDLESDIGEQGILPNIVIDGQYRIALHSINDPKASLILYLLCHPKRSWRLSLPSSDSSQPFLTTLYLAKSTYSAP
ncbi:hypothetical protein COL26b_013242 [Colletotrichum chrysophilum]|uniref:uncharacterized protein n=1 Tax=Colletotrichum chrysophilum TaxID=1836956 RepID=UPI0023000325|nr:uncharacterized protein COL26b_013242 [Colletotrichum chrysophilum]KAJ0362732.1 hypothetical protein COL26b_013242 [Colletotrichum chrysophilum]